MVRVVVALVLFTLAGCASGVAPGPGLPPPTPEAERVKWPAEARASLYQKCVARPLDGYDSARYCQCEIDGWETYLTAADWQKLAGAMGPDGLPPEKAVAAVPVVQSIKHQCAQASLIVNCQDFKGQRVRVHNRAVCDRIGGTWFGPSS